jgi:hypothetical protein
MYKLYTKTLKVNCTKTNQQTKHCKISTISLGQFTYDEMIMMSARTHYPDSKPLECGQYYGFKRVPFECDKYCGFKHVPLECGKYYGFKRVPLEW